MNKIKTLLARIYQLNMALAQRFLIYHEPEIVSLKDLIKILKDKNITNVMFVMGKTVYRLNLAQDIINKLNSCNIKTFIFSGAGVDPSIEDVEEGLKFFKESESSLIISIGGGSSLDCAKMIMARYSNPTKSVEDMKGLLKVRKKKCLLVAIPTTAGSGSEATIAAVITNKETKDKYAITSPKLLPDYVILDPTLLVNLAPNVTSTTGLDALTHAIECYLNKFHPRKYDKYCLKAIKLIFENLENSYRDPFNLTYRKNMQEASYLAGVAFTNGYVGYVHAISHALGGEYHIPHGLLNAVILPHCLRKYGNKIEKKMAKIYDYVFYSNKLLTNKEKAYKMIDEIEKLEKVLSISNNFSDLIKKNDIEKLSLHAYSEAYPLYPCPRMLNAKEIGEILQHLTNI